MLQEERYDKILTILSETGYLTLKGVQKSFSISPATARRDFIELAERNLVERYRGGIRLRKNKEDSILAPLEIRKIQNSHEKEVIALRAAKLVNPGDVLFLDGGTSTLYFARCLPKQPHTIITNSLAHASAVNKSQADMSQIEMIITGGVLFPSWELMYGPLALSCLAEYHAHWLFLSGQGLNEDGLFNPHAMVVEIERAMVAKADKVVVLADHSKIGVKSMSRICGLDKINIIITTENKDNKEILQKFQDAGVQVITVPL